MPPQVFVWGNRNLSLRGITEAQQQPAAKGLKSTDRDWQPAMLSSALQHRASSAKLVGADVNVGDRVALLAAGWMNVLVFWRK